MSYYAYTPITDDPVVLDLTGCNNLGDLHQRIRKTFGFPAYYGENWDAMWDCLTDVFGANKTRQIYVKGFHALPDDMQDACQPMRQIFDDLQKEYPQLAIAYI